MADQGEHYERSWILHHILDRTIGSRELLDIKRKMTLVKENVTLDDKAKYLVYHTGSMSEGFSMKGSDADTMFIDRTVEVMCSNQDTNTTSDNRDMTVLVMRKADCRPCYVTLELVQEGRYFDEVIMQSIVPVRDRFFVSSEINSKLFQELIIAHMHLNVETHGPASSLKAQCSGFGFDVDHHCALACRHQGLLLLATFYYQTGNYMKALMACGTMLSSFRLFVDRLPDKNGDKYQHLYCGRGYTLLHKCREAVVSCVKVYKDKSMFCPPQLHQELTECEGSLVIPPLPYAMFLSFLCYHELGDRRRRDTALTQLRAVKYDEQQGRSRYWIVNNLLGICYELVGDTRRAIREYKESLSGPKRNQQFNPARKKIARLQHSQDD